MFGGEVFSAISTGRMRLFVPRTNQNEIRSPCTITNIDEKGFLMGLSPRTRVITRQGKKNPHVKQDEKRDFKSSWSHQPSESESTFPLDKTPYTKCQFLQQTNQALASIKGASYGNICKLIIKFFHTAEYMATKVDIAGAQAQKLREALKEVPPGKIGCHQMRDSTNLAGVMSGAVNMRTMEERDRKDQEKGSKRCTKDLGGCRWCRGAHRWPIHCTASACRSSDTCSPPAPPRLPHCALPNR